MQLNPREIARDVALAAALGIATISLVTDESTPARDVPRVTTTTERPSGKPARTEHEVDALAYHLAVRAHLEDAGLGPDDAGRIRATDLLSAPVEPGVEVTTGVNLEAGLAPAGVTLTGPSVGRFRVESVTHSETDDGYVRIEVRATNTSPDTLRLTALLTVEPAK